MNLQKIGGTQETPSVIGKPRLYSTYNGITQAIILQEEWLVFKKSVKNNHQ